MSGLGTHLPLLAAETHAGEGVKQLPALPHQMTGRPPVSDHVRLRDPGLHDLCRPGNLHLPYHGNLHHDLPDHQILYPAPQDMSAEAVWAPQATAMPVQNLLP